MEAGVGRSTRPGLKWVDICTLTRPRRYNAALAASAAMAAEIENVTDAALTAKVVLVASGLDGRSVRRELGTVTAPGRGKVDVSLAPRDFPIQSDSSTAYVVAQLEYTSQGAQKVIPSKPVYHHFVRGMPTSLYGRSRR